MQKVIFISIDVQELVAANHETFSFSSCEELNELLEDGWELEEWSFLLDDPIDNKVPIMVVLNNDMVTEDADELWREWDDEEAGANDSLLSAGDDTGAVA